MAKVFGPDHPRGRARRPGRLPVWLAWAGGWLAVAGCAVGPDYQRPKVAEVAEVTPEWKAVSHWKPAQPRDTEIKPAFWEVFRDDTLSGLEQTASTNNPDLRAAFERVEQARAVARISKADLFPTLSLDPNGNRTLFTKNRPEQPNSLVLGYQTTTLNVPFDLSYEIDLWGRVRRSFHSARELAQAGEAERQTLLLSLQADLAQNYFTLRSVDLNRRVVAEAIVLREKNLKLIQSLHEGGAGTALEVAQAQTELASAQADLVGLELRRTQLENAIGLLCGRQVSRFHIEETSRTYRPPSIPVGLPADLIERRPDVAQAERTLASANEAIGVAKAAFFPTVRLTGSAGFESGEVKDLFSWESAVWSLGPSVSLPLFAGGRNRAGVARAESAYREVVERYRGQVLIAFREVEDSLAGLRLLGDQFDAQIRALEAAKKASELSRIRFKEGLVSYFEVVLADRAVLDNEITAYGINGQRMVNTVQLIKALGGGWRAGATPAQFSSAAPVPASPVPSSAK